MTPQFTLQTFAFTFNNKEMTIIEKQAVSKYVPPPSYFILMSFVFLATLIISIGIPVTLALDDSYYLAEIINSRRSTVSDDPTKKKETIPMISGFSIFVHKHVKGFLGIG